MAYALVIGFGQGFQPIFAINYSAKQYVRVKASFRYALITATGFLIAAVLILPHIFGIDGLTWCKPVSGACAVLFSLLIGMRAWKKYFSCEEKGVS